MKKTSWYILPILILTFGSTMGLKESNAIDLTWTPTLGSSFNESANWTPAGIPGSADNAIFDDPTTTAVLSFTGTQQLGSFTMGKSNAAVGGSLQFSAGELVVTGIGTSYVGDEGSLDSTLTLDGTAVMLYDGPTSGGGAGLGSDGGGRDLEVGAQSGLSGALGLVEVRDDAILRIADDLKIGGENDGNGEVLIEGNGVVTVGSGVSVSERDRSTGKLTVAGNGLLVSGNSAGAGNTADGLTNEGYLTLSVRADGSSEVLIQDSGKIYTRSLQHRLGQSDITIEDSGELHVFDTFAFAAPDLGVATIGGVPGANFAKAAHTAQEVGSVFTLTMTDNAVFSVDSALDAGTGLNYQGFALSGGNNNGEVTTTGGSTLIDIQDSASFTVQQDLLMTLASSATPVGAESTLKITGPDATVNINGDLLMSFDPIIQLPNADPSTLSAVITDSTHSTIVVGGDANIAAGSLDVDLSGYSPIGGESYTLLTSSTITGSSFANVDLSGAPLPSGLTWDLQVGVDSIVLNVLGSLSLTGDFDSNGFVSQADLDIVLLNWGSGTFPGEESALIGGGPFDGLVSQNELDAVLLNWGNGTPPLAALAAVPEPTSLALMGFAVGALLINRKRN